MAHALREHSREKASRHIATQGVLSIAVNALGLSGGQAQLVGLAGRLDWIYRTHAPKKQKLIKLALS